MKLGKRERKNYVQLAIDLCYTARTVQAIREANTDEEVQYILLNARLNGGDYTCTLAK